LQQRRSGRDLALFNLAVDSKLHGCDLVSLRVDDVCTGGRLRARTMVRQKKSKRPAGAAFCRGGRSAKLRR